MIELESRWLISKGEMAKMANPRKVDLMSCFSTLGPALTSSTSSWQVHKVISVVFNNAGQIEVAFYSLTCY